MLSSFYYMDKVRQTKIKSQVFSNIPYKNVNKRLHNTKLTFETSARSRHIFFRNKRQETGVKIYLGFAHTSGIFAHNFSTSSLGQH